MKLEHMIMVSLILAILTIGAVNASQDISDGDLALDKGMDESLQLDDDSSLSEEDDMEDGDDYDDSNPICIYDEAPINDPREPYGEMSLAANAQGNISVAVDGNVLINRSLDQFDRSFYTYEDDDGNVLVDESEYDYWFYLKDLDFDFVAGNTYEFTVSYFDGENSYSCTENVTIYEKDMISENGISIEMHTGQKVYLDDPNWIVKVYAPVIADGNVTVIVWSGEDQKYVRTLALADIDDVEEGDEENVYWIYPSDIDSDFEIGTYDVQSTYTQDGMEPISIKRSITFTTFDEEDNVYRGEITAGEISLNDKESVLVKVYCPEKTLGWFEIRVSDEEYEQISQIRHYISAEDYGHDITWNMSDLNITSAGTYNVGVRHYDGSDDEWGFFICENSLRIVDESQFRVNGSEAYISFDGDIFQVFCPVGSEGKNITLNITDWEDNHIPTATYIVRGDDEGRYKGFTFAFMNIHESGHYHIDVLVDGESLGDPVWFNAKAFLDAGGPVEMDSEAMAYVILPPNAQGTIILRIGNKEYFQKSTDEFSPDNINEDFNDAVAYMVYCEDLNEEIEPGIYEIVVVYNTNDNILAEMKEVTLYRDNEVEDDATGISIRVNPGQSEFATAIVPFASRTGNISIEIGGEEYINIDLSTYEGYDPDYDDGNAIYRFYMGMLYPEVYGIEEVKITYLLDGEAVISTQDKVRFSEREDSELEFNESEIAFDYGFEGRVSFTVDGATVDEENITVIGHPEAVISLNGNEITVSGLQADTYTLQVTTTPDRAHNAVTRTLPITVRNQVVPEAADLAVEVQSIDLGDNLTIYITINDKAEGFVHLEVRENSYGIVIPGSESLIYERAFDVKIENGMGNVTLDDLTASGKYDVVASFIGSELVSSDEFTTAFNVLEDSDLKMEFDNITVGSDLIVNISMKDKGPFTTVYLEFAPYANVPFVSVNGGKGQATIGDLAVGIYKIRATFEGNDYLRKCAIEDNVIVYPEYQDTELEVKVENVTVGSDVTVEIRFDDSVTGTVYVTINGDTQSKSFNEALIDNPREYNFTFTDVPAGTYEVRVNYTGTPVTSSQIGSITYYNPIFRNATLKVKPIPVFANLTVTADSIFEGQTATVKVVINQSATGKVTINIDGEEKEIEITDGEGTYSIPGLGIGTHEYDVSFEGDEYFLADEKSVSVIVREYDVRIEILNVESEYLHGNFTFRVVNNTDNSNVSGIVVKLTYDGSIISWAQITDENGIASFPAGGHYIWDAPNIRQLEVGKHQFVVSISNETVSSSKILTNMTVTPARLKIDIAPYEEYYGSEKKVNISITYENGDPFTNGVFNIMVPGVTTEPVIGSSDENGTILVSVDKVFKGTYSIVVSNNDTKNVYNISKTGSFTIKPLDAKITVNASDVYVGENATVKVTFDSEFEGRVTINLNGEDKDSFLISGDFEYDLGKLALNDYTLVVKYDADKRYADGNKTVSFKVKRKNIKFNIQIPNVEENNAVTVKVTSDFGFTGDVVVKIGETNISVSMANGEGSAIGPVLPVATYVATLDFAQSDEFEATKSETTFNVTAKSDGDSNSTPVSDLSKITARDLNAYYTAASYSVTVYGADGSSHKNTIVTFKINGKKIGTAITNAKGVATIKLNQKPGTYKIVAEALGVSITKKVTVKHIVTLKKVKVKRSAKKLVIKVTVKVGKKAVSKKKVTLKFKNKKYVAKTNKKGVAKFTIPKKVLKKLKKGKKVTYQATYLKDTVKRTVKVKK